MITIGQPVIKDNKLLGIGYSDWYYIKVYSGNVLKVQGKPNHRYIGRKIYWNTETQKYVMNKHKNNFYIGVARTNADEDGYFELVLK